MKQVIKFFIPSLVLNAIDKRRSDQNSEHNYTQWREKVYNNWQKEGMPFPVPHAIKQMMISELQKKSGYKILIETGTYMGDMVEAQKRIFKHIFSIELGKDLHEKTKLRFKDDKHVHLYQGDSGKVLRELLKKINNPAIFWLDGHYSSGITAKGDKECPILEELDAIFSSKKMNHILLIDDARCFTGEGDYPTVDELMNYVKSKNSDYKAAIRNDILIFEK